MQRDQVSLRATFFRDLSRCGVEAPSESRIVDDQAGRDDDAYASDDRQLDGLTGRRQVRDSGDGLHSRDYGQGTGPVELRFDARGALDARLSVAGVPSDPRGETPGASDTGLLLARKFGDAAC
jgi:hypothetical protein